MELIKKKDILNKKKIYKIFVIVYSQFDWIMESGLSVDPMSVCFIRYK